MKWFKHESDASMNSKLIKLRMKYGAEGLGLYWHCVELIAHDITPKNITFELSHDAEILAHELKLDRLKCEEMMRYMIELTLLESSNNTITCLKLAKRLDDTNSKNPMIKKLLDNMRSSDNFRESPNKSETLGESPPRLDETRLDETRLDETKTKQNKAKRFTPPTIEQVTKYCQERQNFVDPQKFIDHYEASGWMRGKNKVKCWKACVRTWEGNSKQFQQPTPSGPGSLTQKGQQQLDSAQQAIDEYNAEHGIQKQYQDLEDGML